MFIFSSRSPTSIKLTREAAANSFAGITSEIDDKARLEFWKTEYVEAAERYENIYKAVWQNFQYLALVSAAILTFGKDSLPTGWILLLAGLPLLFWFLAQFLSMDRYGVAARKRLKELEKQFTKYFKENSANNKIIPEFRHYTDFSDNYPEDEKRGLRKLRVRHAIWLFASVMFVVWFGVVFWAFKYPADLPAKRKASQAS